MLTAVLKAVKDAVLHKDHVLPTAAHNHQPTETYPSLLAFVGGLEQHKKTLNFFFTIYSGCTSMITIKPMFSLKRLLSKD